MKTLWKEVKQGLIWSRFVGKGLAEVIKSPTDGTEKPGVEFKHYFLFKDTINPLELFFFLRILTFADAQTFRILQE